VETIVIQLRIRELGLARIEDIPGVSAILHHILRRGAHAQRQQQETKNMFFHIGFLLRL
jgi:hypothetical protein